MTPDFIRQGFPDAAEGEPIGLKRNHTVEVRHRNPQHIHAAYCSEKGWCVMGKFPPRRFAGPKSGSDTGRTPHRSGLRGKSSGSLEFLLLGLLSACIGVLLFLFFSQT
jgi:hypothetical protein